MTVSTAPTPHRLINHNHQKVQQSTMNQLTFLDNLNIQELKAQQMIEEQRLRLLQQDMDNAVSQMTAAQFNNQLYRGGFDQADFERRNIIALQEELRQLEDRRRAEEILRAKIEEQALLEELKQRQAAIQQQNASEQLFAELDHLMSRRDAMNALDTHRLALGGNRGCNDNFTNQQDIMRSLLFQNNNIDPRATSPVDDFSRFQQSPHISDIANFSRLVDDHAIPSMQARRHAMQAQAMMVPELASSIETNLHRVDVANRNVERNMDPNFLRNFPTKPPMGHEGARHATTRKAANSQPIRFFNNGNEVKHNGDILTIKPKPSHSRKRRGMEQVVSLDAKKLRPKTLSKKKEIVDLYRVSNESETSEEGSSEPMRLSPKKKNRFKLSTYLSDRKYSDDVKSKSDEENEAPFPSKSSGIYKQLKNNEPTQKNVNAEPKCAEPDFRDVKEDDKLDAANVLLGLMKNR